MGDFSTQMQAQEVARAIMVALFDDANRSESDRAADIRAAREAELAAAEEASVAEDAEPVLAANPSRRAVITGGMAEAG